MIAQAGRFLVFGVVARQVGPETLGADIGRQLVVRIDDSNVNRSFVFLGLLDHLPECVRLEQVAYHPTAR